MTDNQKIVYSIIANTLGVEGEDIHTYTDFILDLNASPEDLEKIKASIETSLEVILPDFNEEMTPSTVGELMEIVEDSLL